MKFKTDKREDVPLMRAIVSRQKNTLSAQASKSIVTASIGVLSFYISAEVESKVEEIVRGSSAYKFVLNTLQAREIKINVINGILKGSAIHSTQ